MTQAMTEPTTETPVTPALDKFETITFGYAVDTYQSHWPGLSFTPKGAAKISNIAGLLVGLAQGGQRELAERLAQDLESRLTYLANYGQDVEIIFDSYGKELASPITVPGFRVVLSDDGTMGGFSIAWYGYVSAGRLHEVAKGLTAPEADEWDTYAAKRELRIDDTLTSTRYGWPAWDKEHAHGMSSCDAYYGFAFNGGLLMHGTGQEVFAVDISTQTGPRWSIHT